MRDPNIDIPWHSIRIPSKSSGSTKVVIEDAKAESPVELPPPQALSPAVAEVDEMEDEGIFMNFRGSLKYMSVSENSGFSPKSSIKK